jgi:hypothetical protein
MPSSAGNKTEIEDHSRRARSTLRHAEQLDPPQSPSRELLTALVHSQLAVAEGQERIADELRRLRKTADEQFTWWKRVGK